MVKVDPLTGENLMVNGEWSTDTIRGDTMELPISADMCVRTSTDCWCGHPERHDELTTFGHAFVDGLRVPQLVERLDRLLRCWPWLYRRLGGHA